ncbi:MAG TPA: ATP-binding protein [Vicinamibacterales bacterium]|jgi:signal transduction histidine kinase
METLRVLVVDDETGMRMAIARVLSTFTVRVGDQTEAAVNFDVQTAETGEEALERMAAAVPDIVLLDLKLPGISGLDVLRQISERNIQTLTVMITAYATLETAIDATKRGAHDFLPKPFTPDELRVAVRRVVKHLMVQRQARQLALEKRQVRFQFISVLGHELKAPLAAIEGFLQILKDGTAGTDPVVQAQVVDRALARAGGMRRLISELLDLTRIESGQKRREFSQVDVREVAQAALDTAATAAAERRVSLALHAPEHVWIVADRGELEILFNNLVSNAVKYNRDGGRVEVCIEPTDTGVRFQVADTGIGLSPDEAGRLFQEFVRIKNDRTRAIPGTGLGLSIVKKLAQLYGGDVTVESAPNVGSTFLVVLHAQSAQAANPPAPLSVS